MSTSPSPDPAATVALEIDTDNPAAEVFLLDPQLQLIARGIGSLRTRQVPGVYKIRVRLGRDSEDKLILLDADAAEHIKAPVFASPAPLGDTALAQTAHAAAAERCSQETTVFHGTGSSIFILVRDVTRGRQTTPRRDNLAAGLSLATFEGSTIVNESSAWTRSPASDAWVACQARLAPGTYVLEQQTPQGRLARAIVASPGWQTQVFLMGDEGGDRAAGQPAVAPAGSFEMGTVLMARDHFVSRSSDSKLTELARIALADERPILGDRLRQLLTQKFVNPLQGIFGAHLMLLARDREGSPREIGRSTRASLPSRESRFDAGLYNDVVFNLRELVGGEHPDVEALSLQCSDASLRTRNVFAVPPMLRRSWSLVVAASNDQPAILDVKLWERVMARTMTAPFLSWLTDSEGARTQFQQSVRNVVEDRNKLSAPRSARLEMSEAVAPAPGASSAAQQAEDFQRRLSLDLDMPRSALEKMIREQ